MNLNDQLQELMTSIFQSFDLLQWLLRRRIAGYWEALGRSFLLSVDMAYCYVFILPFYTDILFEC